MTINSDSCAELTLTISGYNGAGNGEITSFNSSFSRGKMNNAYNITKYVHNIDTIDDVHILSLSYATLSSLVVTINVRH